MTRFADSHCHILDPRLIDRAESIVKNMSSDGLDFIVEVSASIPESYESVKFAMAHDNVFCAIGVHPEFAKTYPEDADEFAHWALSQHGNKKIVGYGECGLDYKYSHDAEAQKQCFTHQILLADKLGLPLIVHTRQAFDDTLQILVENKAHIRNGLLFHCFCEGTSEATRVLEHFDAYFAFGGAVTHTPNTLDDTIRTTRLDRMLLETDAPWLNPTAAGGKKLLNEPKNVCYVAQYIADLLNMPIEQIAKATLDNTRKFFRI